MKNKSIIQKLLTSRSISFVIVAVISFSLGIQFQNVKLNSDRPQNSTVITTVVPTTTLPVNSEPTVPIVSADPSSPQITLVDALQLIDDEALFSVDPSKLETQIIQAVLNSIDDPYADWLSTAESQKLHAQINSQYEGMGFDTVIYKGEFYIANVLENSAAFKAGVQTGEALVALNDIPLMGQSSLFESAKSLNKKTPTLTLKSDTQRKVQLYVSPYFEPVVTYKVIDGNYAYIDINTFSVETPDALKKALDSAKADNVSGIIFDVRFNMGGYMSACYESLSYLVDAKVIAYETTKNNAVPITRKHDQVIALPYVVLINHETYSAAELFAQSLKYFGDAHLIGKTTYGKGTLQSLFTSETGTIKLSTAYFSATPESLFAGTGIKPDLELEEVYKINQNDHFLEAAKRFLSRGLSP